MPEAGDGGHTERPNGQSGAAVATPTTDDNISSTNSGKEMQTAATTTAADAGILDHTSIATPGRKFRAHFGQRLAKCHKKLANLHLQHHHPLHYNQQQSEKSSMTLQLLSSSSTVELYKHQESETSSLCTSEHKQLLKHQQPAMEAKSKSPEKSYGQLRNARRRKRLSFIRRCSKSAPR